MIKESMSPEELRKRLKKIESEKARESLQEDLEKNLPEEEIEDKLFSIKGVKRGRGWEEAKKKAREIKEKNKK